MKKKIKLVIILLILVFILTGCVDSETAFKLNKDDSIDITMTSTVYEEKFRELLEIYGYIEEMSEEEIEYELNEYIKEQILSYEMMEYTTEESFNEQERTTKIIATKHYEDFNDINENFIEILGLTEMSIKDREDGRREISIKIHMFDDTEGLEEFLKFCKYTIKLELPYSVQESNATEISRNKKTLTWDIDFTKEMELTAVTNKVIKDSDGTYRESSSGAIIIIGVAIVVVAVVGIVIILLSKKDKKSEENV